MARAIEDDEGPVRLSSTKPDVTPPASVEPQLAKLVEKAPTGPPWTATGSPRPESGKASLCYEASRVMRQLARVTAALDQPR